MKIENYRFEIEGTGANDQTWKTSGVVTCGFDAAFDQAMYASFQQITGGRAVFGKPGVGCNGPYDVRRVLIERADG